MLKNARELWIVLKRNQRYRNVFHRRPGELNVEIPSEQYPYFYIGNAGTKLNRFRIATPLLFAKPKKSKLFNT
jgi:hypothetical protein